jgi:hypothetical protein
VLDQRLLAKISVHEFLDEFVAAELQELHVRLADITYIPRGLSLSGGRAGCAEETLLIEATGRNHAHQALALQSRPRDVIPSAGRYRQNALAHRARLPGNSSRRAGSATSKGADAGPQAPYQFHRSWCAKPMETHRALMLGAQMTLTALTIKRTGRAA